VERKNSGVSADLDNAGATTRRQLLSSTTIVRLFSGNTQAIEHPSLQGEK